MRKPVKLPDSKNKANARGSGKKTASERAGGHFVLFVKDQGEGAARVWVIILKIAELILTTIFGVMLGIFGPIAIRHGGIVEEEIASDPSAVWWLATSCVYIIGLFTVMLGRSKTAAAIHTAAAAGTLITYSKYMELFKDVETSNGPTALYMPCLFITLLTLAIMLIINVPKWLDRHMQKISEAAPSILDENKRVGKGAETSAGKSKSSGGNNGKQQNKQGRKK